jgi:hypothetical protein
MSERDTPRATSQELVSERGVCIPYTKLCTIIEVLTCTSIKFNVDGSGVSVRSVRPRRRLSGLLIGNLLLLGLGTNTYRPPS